jgi:hypothetical protein
VDRERLRVSVLQQRVRGADGGEGGEGHEGGVD